MKMEPFVSVIIPFYNHIEWLYEAIESIFRQNYNNYEIILINDGSSEDLTDLIKKYEGKIKYIHQNNQGAAVARNTGLKNANGKYIAFLDSDDIWLPDKLNHQISYMETQNAIWSYTDYITFGNNENRHYQMSKNKNLSFHRFYSRFIATPTVVIKADYLHIHNECIFNPKLRYGQDAYMWLTISAKEPILYIPEELTKVRMRGANVSRLARKQLIARANLWIERKNKPDLLITPFQISLLRKFANELIVFDNTIIERISKLKISENKLELLSKIVFIFPWIIQKIDNILKCQK